MTEAAILGAARAEREEILRLERDAFLESFARGPAALRHALVGHPRFSWEAIAQLADAMPRCDVERHLASQPLILPGGAPDMDGRPSDTVRGIATNGAWLVLWFIERRPEYREVLEACLAEVRAVIGKRDGGMSPRRHEEFLFVSSPRSLTPIHFDPEHNLLLQIAGSKEIHYCAFGSAAEKRAELERYYDGGHRNLTAMPRGTDTAFVLRPGEGVYVPSFFPHWVRNGDEPCVSLSITFRSRASERRERVSELNARLRRMKLFPRPPGESAVVDAVKEAVLVGGRGVNRWLKRLKGKSAAAPRY